MMVEVECYVCGKTVEVPGYLYHWSHAYGSGFEERPEPREECPECGYEWDDYRDPPVKPRQGKIE